MNSMLNQEVEAASFLKIKIYNGQHALSYIGPTFWNKTPDALKRSNNLNTFKHNFKKYILKELKNSSNSF